MRQFAKAIYATVVAGLGALAAVLVGDIGIDDLTAGQWVTIVLAALVAGPATPLPVPRQDAVSMSSPVSFGAIGLAAFSRVTTFAGVHCQGLGFVAATTGTTTAAQRMTTASSVPNRQLDIVRRVT